MDMDKLIQLVEQHPVLWDKGSTSFKDRYQKDKAWSEVAEEMYGTLSDEEKREKVSAVKSKWKNIRDCFMKSISEGKSGDSATKKKKYIYSDALSFLLNSMDKRSTSGNMEAISLISTPNSSPDEERVMDDLEEDTPPDIDDTQTSTPPPRKRQLAKSRKSVTPFQASLLEKLEKRANSLQEDADKSFLMSVLPDMRSLDDAAKRDFKMYVLKYFSQPTPSFRVPFADYPNPLPPHPYGSYYQTDWYSQPPNPPQPGLFPSPRPPISSPSTSQTADYQRDGPNTMNGLPNRDPHVRKCTFFGDTSASSLSSD